MTTQSKPMIKAKSVLNKPSRPLPKKPDSVTIKGFKGVTLGQIGILETLENTGKSAGVLLTVANAMYQDKSLPKWAKHLGEQVFITIFKLSDDAMTKLCGSDHLHVLRSIINMYLSDKKLSQEHYDYVVRSLTTNTFKNNALLLDIKHSVENPKPKQLDMTLDIDSEVHSKNVNESKPQAEPQAEPIIETPFEVVTSNLKNLSKDELLLLIELADKQINNLDAQETKKAS